MSEPFVKNVTEKLGFLPINQGIDKQKTIGKLKIFKL